ncbi:MAG: response regulator [Parcubacteria group bacterium]|jgi:CheY-like chemotaxis protein
MTKIIIVEDDPMISEIYHRKFSESGFEVLIATSAEQALNLARVEENVDLIMTDLIMPKMDGFQLIEALRGEGYDQNIKIIVTSNLSERADQERAAALGANGFVAKSDYSPSELVSEIERLMDQYQQQYKNSARLEKAKNGKADSNGKKVLLIEDEEIFIEMFGEKLKQDGFVVEAARNGAWGVKEAMKNQYDILVVDMVMPAMTGEEMVAKIKLSEEKKNIPIIVLSASVEDDVAKRVKEMGVQAFFVKTQITPSMLSRKIEELLGMPLA